ncbi:MAG: ABC transporter permease, partial [Bacteroidota bacterium]
INMITTLLISVLEKTNMIGILKALGSDNKLVRKVFLYHAGFLIMRGMLWGNILGVGLLSIQHFTGIIKLDQASYFVSTVPVYFSLLYILLINLGTLLISLLMLILPSYIIASVSPVKAITFR